MTQPGIEPGSLGPLANILLIWPMSRFHHQTDLYIEILHKHTRSLIDNILDCHIVVSPHVKMAETSDCSLKVNEFKLQFHFYFHFRKRY